MAQWISGNFPPSSHGFKSPCFCSKRSSLRTCHIVGKFMWKINNQGYAVLFQILCWHYWIESSRLDPTPLPKDFHVDQGSFHKALSTNFGAGTTTNFCASITEIGVPNNKIQFSISKENFGVLNTKIGA